MLYRQNYTGIYSRYYFNINVTGFSLLTGLSPARPNTTPRGHIEELLVQQVGYNFNINVTGFSLLTGLSPARPNSTPRGHIEGVLLVQQAGWETNDGSDCCGVDFVKQLFVNRDRSEFPG